MGLAGPQTEAPVIFLRPRPLARSPGSFILLPLLPRPRPLKPLPSEVWSKVLSYVIDDGEDGRMGAPERRVLFREKWRLLFVCKPWVDVVLPLLYSRVHIFTVSTLQKFATHLYSSDQRWDSIRRIPYSTPGRWVQMLDLSEVVFVHSTDLLSVDSNLARMFPLLPFLRSLYLNPEMLLSNRTLVALQTKDGISDLRSLKGLKISVPGGHASVQHFVPNRDAVTDLLWHCPRLEQLDIVCTDAINPELESVIDLDLSSLRDEEGAGSLPPPLHLPYLRSLCLSAVPICPLFLTLLRTPLPALRHLMVTPCSDQHTSQLSTLLSVHGCNLISLRINTPRHLPTSTGDPSPSPVLTSCPELHYLALDHPLPVVLTLPAQAQGVSPHPHPLRVLTIPRPSARFLREVEVLLPCLPALTVVRARAVRWLRAGVSGKALEAGVQGEMHEWRRRLARRGVRLVDGEWRDPG
ncbi:hypothetical protein BJV78DRAFT_1274337 [Lactifluus subvellereus]|nr:hypothetical protein BJV78DRAFT_1274337 [Lactifluus subvellereus]